MYLAQLGGDSRQRSDFAALMASTPSDIAVFGVEFQHVA